MAENPQQLTWSQLNAELEQLRRQPQTPEVIARMGAIDDALDAIEYRKGVEWLEKREN